MKKIVIIGVGLIGGAIGKAVIARGLADEVVGVCRRDVSLEKALKAKAVTSGVVGLSPEAVEGADMIIIATPVTSIKNTLDELAGLVNNIDLIVSDVGSTKKEIVEYAAQYKDKFYFIGAHPLAGGEKTGVDSSREDLFEGSVCVITPEQNVDEGKLKELNDFWKTLGANIDLMEPDKHDEILAFTSHLPHVLAYSLAGSQKVDFSRYMSTGFKDTSRIASSDPTLWTDIFMSNKKNVLRAIGVYKEILSGIEKDILSEQEGSLKNKLTEYKKVRDDIV